MEEKIHYSSEHASPDYLRVNSCGEQWLSHQDWDTLRPRGRIDYAIQYISRGQGAYEEGGRLTPVLPGSLILYFPGVRQHYCFQKENRTLLRWVHFTGAACACLEPLRTGGAVVVRLRAVQEFEQAFDRLLQARYLRPDGDDLLSEGYLWVLLSLLLRSARPAIPSGGACAHEGILQVLNEMHLHFNEPIDLKKYAALCFVSPSRFVHLFKQATGTSPYHYQLQLRMECARDLLAFTPASVGACAEAVGYQDCSYFCRLFKKYTGMTPLACRKK